LKGRRKIGGCDPDEPRTQGTSCAIPGMNVPKLIFGEGETEKVSPKVSLDQAIDEKVSPNNIILNLKKFFESL
jgi:hypothetical protein